MRHCTSESCDYFREYGECANVCIANGIKKVITNGDRIRAMSDEELADLITRLMSAQRTSIFNQLRKKGIVSDVCVIETPMMAKGEHLKWLKEPT